MKTHQTPITTDCSGFVTGLAFTVGIPDPNGLGYNGQGFTGTLMQHLPHIEAKDAVAGDLVTFGPYPGVHTVMLMEAGAANGGNPLVASHGMEGGPLVYRLAIAASYHHTLLTFLRIMPPSIPQVPTWTVRNGRNEVLARHVKHPALWAEKHPKMFRHFGQVNFIRDN
jgi:hypothetical protein